MGVLEDVTNMQNEGKTEEEITNELRERGVSPKDINDALSQSQIKNAVSDEGEFGPPGPPQSFQEQAPSGPSVQEASEEDIYTPSPQYQYSPQTQEYAEQNYPEQQYQEYYPQAGYGGEYQATDTDTMIEVSEQVFSEKIRKIKKQVEELNEFKVMSQTRIENAIERLKKIENTIDKLQSAILEKVGSYGENLSDIKREMSMMQDSFRKVAGGHPVHQAHTITHKKPSKKTGHAKTKKKTSRKK